MGSSLPTGRESREDYPGWDRIFVARRRTENPAITGGAGSLRRPTAIDDDVGAGDKPGGVGTEEHGQRSNFFQTPPTA